MVNRFNPGHQEPTTVRRIDQTEHQHSHSHSHTHSQQQNQSKLSQNHQTNKIQKFNNKSQSIVQRNRKGSKTMFYNQISTNEHTQPIDETSPPTVRSHYHLSRDELVRGIANRLIFSQVYIYVYLTMIILSLMTILVSILSSHCGSVTFYVLEVLINTAMILEVSIRLVAFGKKFWKSKLNILDCVITVICLMTMIILFWKGCQAKREEVLDVIILVVRNLIQFIRLALILRRSGKSIFTRIEPIDLEGVIHSADSTSLMLDMDDDEEEYAFGRQARFSVMNRPNNQSNPKDQVPFFADQD